MAAKQAETSSGGGGRLDPSFYGISAKSESEAGSQKKNRLDSRKLENIQKKSEQIKDELNKWNSILGVILENEALFFSV